MIDQIYIINIDKRNDKWLECQNELCYLGKDVKIVRWSGIVPDEKCLNSHWNIYSKNSRCMDRKYYSGILGCKLSHLGIIEDAKIRGFSRILILEDDFHCINDVSKMINELVDGDMVYLGGKHCGALIPYEKNIYRTTRTSTTHAYILDKRLFETILTLCPIVESEMDIFYMNYIHPRFMCLCVQPNIIVQRSSFSDIENRMCYYKELYTGLPLYGLFENKNDKYIEWACRMWPWIKLDDDSSKFGIRIRFYDDKSSIDWCNGACDKLCKIGEDINYFLVYFYPREMDIISRIIINNKPYFHGRIGGTIWDNYIRWIYGNKVSIEELKMKEGYWSNVSNVGVDEYFGYIREGYLECDSVTVGNAMSMSLFGYSHPECRIDPVQVSLGNEQYIVATTMWKEISSYNDIELFNHFHRWYPLLENKHVLVATPFKNSILCQYDRIISGVEIFNKEYINGLNERPFDGFVYPKFKLDVLETPVTYYYDGIKYDDEDWCKSADRLVKELEKREYDILLLGCGGYSYPLGAMAKKMGKIAIYIGGVLQLFFGIKGRRYEMNDKFIKMMTDEWIRPIELSERRIDKNYPDAYSAYW